MREGQPALRTNDRWLPEEKGPTTDADFGCIISAYDKFSQPNCPFAELAPDAVVPICSPFLANSFIRATERGKREKGEN